MGHSNHWGVALPWAIMVSAGKMRNWFHMWSALPLPIVWLIEAERFYGIPIFSFLVRHSLVAQILDLCVMLAAGNESQH